MIHKSTTEKCTLYSKPVYRVHFFFVLLISFGFVSADNTAQWPRFRGPNGSGVNVSHVLPTEWKEENFSWQTRLPGKGHGSPVIWGDRIFLLSAEAIEPPAAPNDGKSKKQPKRQPAVPQKWIAMAVSRTDGKILWKKEFVDRGNFKGHRFNSAASSTAAVDSQRVVFCWGTADRLTVVALSHFGDVFWEKDMGPVVGGHGFGGSPILYNDLVILNNDQEKKNGNLFALDAKTGELAWNVPRQSERISYSVPCVFRNNVIFVNWQHGFTAINPKTGSVNAELSVFAKDKNERAISSPIVAGDMIIGTCGFTANPKHCVALRLNGTEFEEAWRIEKNVPHIPCVITRDELTFLWDDQGIVTCVKTETGEQVWKERLPNMEGTCFGSPVSDGKHIFCADESGNIHVIAASKDFKYVACNPLKDTCKTTPAIADGWMYIRTEHLLHAIKP